MTVRAVFLIVVGAAALHLSLLSATLVVVVYMGLEALDAWIVKRERRKRLDTIYDYELSGWTTDADDPKMETNGDIVRVKLPAEQQIVVTRIANLLRETLR